MIWVHVTSIVDQNNSLLIGSPQNTSQLVKNASARLIVGLKKRDHVTSTIIMLQWLPIQYRVLYKVLHLPFNGAVSLVQPFFDNYKI